MNNVAGAAVTFKKASEPQFRDYTKAILANARALAAALMADGVKLVTDGTDNHLMVIDTVASFGLDGRAAEEALDRIGITTNKQIIPDDPRPPLRPSGVRLGTPACTTRGMDESDMRALAGWIVQILRAPEDAGLTAKLRSEIQSLCRRHPVPGIG
jgi:glycine hydroxymethyltransferase